MQMATVQQLTKIVVAQAKAIEELSGTSHVLSSTSSVALGMQVSSLVHQHGQHISATNDALYTFDNRASVGYSYSSGLQVLALTPTMSLL